ncbi:MAG: peptidylprolyl isomerase [Candidatus Aenigmatarchaeota archaeon]
MKKGDFVTINYIGKIEESGELFDTTKEEVAEKRNALNPNAKYEPVTVIVGAEMVLPGVEEQLEEMEVGEEREFELPPEKAFGERDSDNIETHPERKFEDQGMTPYSGMRVNINGRVGRILSVSSGRVKVDLNHPLAGKTLEYELEVSEKIEEEEEKVKAVVSYYLSDSADVEIEDGKATVTVEKEVPEQIQEEIENKLVEYTEVEEVEFIQGEKDEDQSE